MSLFVGIGIGVLAMLIVLWIFTRTSSRGGARDLDRVREEATKRLDEMEADRSSREAILSAIEDGVVLFDRSGSVLYRNDRAMQLLGGRLDSARGLVQPRLRELVMAAASGSTPQPVEVAVGPAPSTLLGTAVPIPSGQTLLVLRDVTQARTIDAVRRDFVANASHDLKTPVASIQALAETVVHAAANDPGEVPRFAEQLEREAMRLSRIVSDLLDLSRLESEAVSPPTEVRLDRVVADEVDRIRGRAAESGLALEAHIDERALVKGSFRDLALLARNLLENAVQYTRPGGRIEVTVQVEEAHAILTVRDTGMGIPARDQGRIFERFYRVDRARSRETGGTGLGLAIVKHVVENHGGKVDVRSELGRGSTFTVRIPPA